MGIVGSRYILKRLSGWRLKNSGAALGGSMAEARSLPFLDSIY